VFPETCSKRQPTPVQTAIHSGPTGRGEASGLASDFSRSAKLCRIARIRARTLPDEKNSLAKPQEVSEAFPRNIWNNKDC